MATNYSQQWYDAYTSGEITYQDYTDEHYRTGGQFPVPPQTFESRTDPWTAYMRTQGLLGKTSFNPAERYQANLYGPMKGMYDIAERQQPMFTPGQGGMTSFTDFLRGAAGGRPGLSSLFSVAANQLKNIFGATQEQQNLLGYEPGAYLPEGGTANVYDPGNIEELQNLMGYGLRTKYGPSGARWAAGRLPELQGAYYGQRVGGQAGAQTNFIDWLRANYPHLTAW